MNQPIDNFSFILPPERIAQFPANPRESANLMVLDTPKESIQLSYVKDFVSFLNTTDVLVINNTKVFKARLHGKTPSGATVEIFLIRPVHDNQWMALGKPGKKIRVHDTIHIAEFFDASIINKDEQGMFRLTFNKPYEEVIALANTYGEIPVPPYIKKIPTDGSYQTVYASQVGSVAAPTAGFHLTDSILQQIKEKGIQIIEITLHVGIGTFMPIKTETLESHVMHSEWVHISKQTAEQINSAKKNKRRIVAVGTTTVRSLEGVAAVHDGILSEFSGDVNIFITPGYAFSIVDAMLTNFHLPKSTLIVLVSAFAGTTLIKNAYQKAIDANYRFYSFGDAMFIQK